jgi:Tfp pilus assembly protein PilF
MKENRSFISIVVLLFIFAMFEACSTAPPVQQNVSPGLKFEVSEQAKNHNAKGLEYAEKGLYDQAIEEYKKAINIAPSYAEAYTNCSTAYYAVGNNEMSVYYILKRDDILTQKERAIRENKEISR